MTSQCEDFDNLFQHVDNWLKAGSSDGKGDGFLFVPQIMDMAIGQNKLKPVNLQRKDQQHHQETHYESGTETVPSDEIDPEYLKAVLINRQHVQDRENRKSKQAEAIRKEDIQYVEIAAKETLELNTKRKSTVEQKLLKRRRLYLNDSADDLKRIENLENELQNGFDDFMKRNRPKLWPCIPIRLTFHD